MKTFWNRRDFLFRSSGGIGGLALTQLLAADRLTAAPTHAIGHHFAPRAKAIISLFMMGGDDDYV